MTRLTDLSTYALKRELAHCERRINASWSQQWLRDELETYASDLREELQHRGEAHDSHRAYPNSCPWPPGPIRHL